MRNKIGTMCGLLAISLFAFNAYGVDLKNVDDGRYEVKISSGATTTSTSIEGRTTQTNICSDCEIEVVGIGKIRADGSSTVIIRDGKLSKE